MICCGKVVESNYCPDCGKKIKSNDVLDDILEHIRFELKKHVRRKEKIENNIVEPYRNEIPKLDIWIKKWKAWENEIITAKKNKNKVSQENNGDIK